MTSTEDRIVISPCRRVEGHLAVPGDKSISHRALFVTGLAEGESSVGGLSPAADVRSTLAAMRHLGVEHRNGDHQAKVYLQGLRDSSRRLDREILVSSPGWGHLLSPEEPLDVGNSGTTIRLLMGILAGSRVTAELTGDASIRRRPMGRVIQPLRAMGAQVEGSDADHHAPISIRGTELHGADHVLPVASAQVKSALIFAGLRATGSTSIAEPAPSRDHTERMLSYLGVHLEKETDRLIVKSISIPPATLVVPGDLSSAAFPLVAAAVLPDSHVVVEGVGVNPTRAGILRILQSYGADLTIHDAREVCGEPTATVEVRAADRRPLEVSGEVTVAAIDELPLVGILGAFAEGETVVRDAGELRVKESDRVAAITEGLRRMGADIVPTPDGFVIRGPSRLRGTSVDSAGDHRIAMALAVAALAAEGETTITGWSSVAVSYPGFEHDLEALVVR